MRRQAIAAALCAAFIAPGASARELLEFYRQSLDNDAQLQAAAHARDAALEAKPQARGALLPQLSGSGVWSTQTDEITTDLGPPVGEQVSESSSEPYTLSLSLSQSLFNWELISRLQQSDDQVALAEAGFRSARQDLALRVTTAYFNVLAAADGLRFAEAERLSVERQLEQAKKRFEVGLSAITDVQEAQARYDLTVAQKIEAEQLLSSAIESLKEITGGPSQPQSQLAEQFPMAGPQPASIDEWVKAAQQNNLDLLSARIVADIADRDIAISRAGHFPSLALTGSQVNGESSGFNRGEFDQQRWSLQLSVPLFAGGVTQSRVRAATSTHEQRLAELESTRRAVERTTRNAYQGVIAGVARVTALKQAVLSNTTALEASDTGLQVGTRTAVDVLNAQRELFRAQRDYARARYDYLLNLLRLKSAAGRLAEPDVAEVDALLTGS